MKINIGCGDKLREGYVNVDVCGNPDVKWDLSVFPWPFEDGCAEEVYSEHFLEHVVDFEKTMLEINRILAKDGRLHSRVPHFRSPMTPWHPHLQQFSGCTCMRLGECYPYVFGGRQLFRDVKVRFNFPFLSRSLARLVSWLANKPALKWEYLGLPIDEIEFWATRN